MKAFKTSIPVFFCYFPLGIVFGMLWVEQGFFWLWAPVFSLLVYAGAAQFLGLTLLAAGASLPMIALAVFPLGLRNVFYGMAMVERFRPFSPLTRAYLAHGLVDTTFSLLVLNPKATRAEITRLTFYIQLYWVAGTFAGALLSKGIPLPPGLEFCLPALIFAMAVENFLVSRAMRPLIICTVVAPIAFLVAPHAFFLTAVALAALPAFFLKPKEAVA